MYAQTGIPVPAVPTGLPCCTFAAVAMTIPETGTVQFTSGEPYPDLTVYAFAGDTCTCYHDTTDAEGKVSITLPEGSCRFRADYDGVQFWAE